jgi:hypothetical protein
MSSGFDYRRRGQDETITTAIDGSTASREYRRETEDWRYNIDVRVTYRIAIPTSLNISAGYDRDHIEQLEIPGDFVRRDYSSYGIGVNVYHYLY